MIRLVDRRSGSERPCRKRRLRQCQCRKGFTLLELFLTLAMAVVLMTLIAVLIRLLKAKGYV